MEPYYSDESVTLWHGDSLAVLREMPDASVDCCVTSPPYFGLRDYGVEGQYGLEASPAEYVETMRSVFAEVRRVLADDGTLWLNLGDSYVSKPPGNVRGVSDATGLHGGRTSDAYRDNLAAGHGTKVDTTKFGLPEKNLIGIPWRTAFALQDDGWILRSDIIWAKSNGMPESVTDRVRTQHEHVFMLTKSRRYWFDLDPIREPVVYPAGSPALNWARDTKEADVPGQSMRQHRTSRTHGKAAGTNLAPTGSRHDAQDERGKNPGDVWTLPTQPFHGAHFAVMPTRLAERCVLAGCKPSGTVLDPFSGAGTTGLAAAKHGRHYIGIDISSDHLDTSLRTRLAQPGLDLTGGVA
jgi:site-specific DNA-methyltransferase (cytosine-N4-specific)